MENGLQNDLKCILRDIDFHFFPGEVQPPLSYSFPTCGLRQSVQNFGFQLSATPPLPPPSPAHNPSDINNKL